MLPKWHILAGFAVSYILVVFFSVSPIAGIIIFFSSFMIDFDHYIYYVFEKKNFHPGHSVRWFLEFRRKWSKLTKEERKGHRQPILIFHGLEFGALLFFLSLVNRLFFFLFLGMIIHMVLDWIDLIYEDRPIFLKISQIYVWQTNKNKKKIEL